MFLAFSRGNVPSVPAFSKTWAIRPLLRSEAAKPPAYASDGLD
jgi:hypothetical protein